MNGVVNSVLRVLDHLDQHGHEALVIAPDTPHGLPTAPRVYKRFPVHLVPAVMVPKVSSLPVGLPQPGITAAINEFDADVVHLASPFLLGAGGLGAAMRLDLPTVAIYQTDVAGFAKSYGLGLASRAAWAWTRRIHEGATRTLAPSRAAAEDLGRHGIPGCTAGVAVSISAGSHRRRSDRNCGRPGYAGGTSCSWGSSVGWPRRSMWSGSRCW